MNLQWNEEQRKLFTRFASLGSSINQARTSNDVFDHGGWKRIAEEGIWRLPVPARYGGKDGSWWDFTAAMEGLSTTVGDLGFLLSMIAHSGCVRVLLNHGTEEQKHSLLPRLMGGGIGATATTEETGGSDVARIRTAAVQTQSGYEINGSKSHITNAPVAHVIVIVGRIPALGKRDITLFVLEREMEGLSFADPESMLGNRTSPTGDILLRGVKVKSNAIVGTPGDGLSVLYNMISLDRALYGVVAAGYSEPVLTQALKHANTRQAFNKRISEHQYVQQRLTDMKIALETSRAISYSALDKLLANAPEAVLMCALAKYVGTEGLFQTAQHAVQLHGHRGYMEGQIAQLLRDATGTRIAGGTSDIQRIAIFNQMQHLLSARAADDNV